MPEPIISSTAKLSVYRPDSSHRKEYHKHPPALVLIAPWANYVLDLSLKVVVRLPLLFTRVRIDTNKMG